MCTRGLISWEGSVRGDGPGECGNVTNRPAQLAKILAS